MKCPQCSFAISSNRDACPRCKLDLSEFKRRMGVKTSRVPVKRGDATSDVQDRSVLPQQESQPTKSSFSAAVDALETIDAQPSAQASAGQKEHKPKDDISDLLEALGELRENSLSSFGGVQEVQFEEVQIAKENNDSWRDEDSLVGASQVTEEQTPAESIEGSLFGGVAEARHATESLAQGFTQSEDTSQEEPEVTPAVEKAPEENRPLPKATATGSFPAQSVTPEVLDFSESDDQFEEHLDAMIGDLVFDVEAVRTEKKEVRPQNNSSMMFDDMEISIEIEMDDEDEEDEEQEEAAAEVHDLEATQAFPAQSSEADDSFDDILASFNELESGTQEHSMASDALASDSSGKSPTVHEPLLGNAAQSSVKTPQASSKALPDSVRATLRAARTQEDPSVKRLAALLAEAYGVNLDEFEELETIDSLEEELNHELGELLSEGTTFYGVNEATPQSESKTTQSAAATGDPELLALEGELLSELEALRQEGITLSGIEAPQVEAPVSDSEAVEPVEEPAQEELPEELRALSDELDDELEELLGAQDLVEMANPSELAHEVAEELDLLASHDDTADELVALSSELSEELAQLESSTEQHELADSTPNAQQQHSDEGQAEDDELGKTDTHEVDAISLAQHTPADEDLPLARVITPHADTHEAHKESSEEQAADELVTVQTGQFFVADLERVTEEHTEESVEDQSLRETEITTEESTEQGEQEENQHALVQTGQFLVSDLDRLSEDQSTPSTLEQADTQESSQEAAQNDSLEDFINEVSFDDSTESDEPTPPEVALTGQFFAEDLAQIEHGVTEPQHDTEPTAQAAETSNTENEEQFATQLTGQFFVDDLAQVTEAHENDQQEEVQEQPQSTIDTNESQHDESVHAVEASEESSSESSAVQADLEDQALDSLEEPQHTPAADEAPYAEDADAAHAFDQADAPVETPVEAQENESLPTDEQAELASLDAELAALESHSASNDEAATTEEQFSEVVDVQDDDAVHTGYKEELPPQIANESQHDESVPAVEASEESSSESSAVQADLEDQALDSLEEPQHTPAADEAPYAEDADAAHAFDQADTPVETPVEAQENESLPTDEQAELASLDAELAALESHSASSDEAASTEEHYSEVVDVQDDDAVHTVHEEELPPQIAEDSPQSEQEHSEISQQIEAQSTQESEEYTQAPEGDTPHDTVSEGHHTALYSPSDYTELDLLQQQIDALEYSQVNVEDEASVSNATDLAALQELKKNLAALAESNEQSTSVEEQTNDAKVSNEHYSELEAAANTRETQAAQEEVERPQTPDVEHQATELKEEDPLLEQERTAELFENDLAELEAGLAELSAPSVHEKDTIAQADDSSAFDLEEHETQDSSEAQTTEVVSTEEIAATTEVDADASAAFDPATTENARIDNFETGTFLTQDLDRLEEENADSEHDVDPEQNVDSYEQEVVAEKDQDEQDVSITPDTSIADIEIPVIARQDWQEVESEVLTALSDENAVFELSFGEIVAFQQNDRINVLFDSVDEEIIDPSKRKRHEVEVVNSKPKQLDNSSLNNAFTRFEQEAQQVAKQKAAERARGIDSFYTALTQERAAAPRRAVAGVIDFISLVLLGMGISLLLFAPFELLKNVIANEPQAHFELLRYGFKILLTCYLTWLIVGGITIASFGRCLGGKLLRLSVVTKEGDPLDIKRALLRSFASTMGIFTLGLSFLLPSLLRRRSFQDFIAHTEVIDGE